MKRLTTTALAALCAAIAVLAGVASALGVFARGDGTFTAVTSARGEVYEVATSGIYADNARQLVAEGIGWDVFTLFVAGPLLLVTALLVQRGSFRGTLLAGGMLGYFLYMYLEYAVTWAFAPLFGLFVAICALSLTGLLVVFVAIGEAGVQTRFTDAFPTRSWAVLSIGMSVVLVLLWTSRIIEGLAAETPMLHGETTMTVQALDLGLVVPTSVSLAVLTLLRVRAALAAATAFAVTFIAMSAAITSMMVSAWLVTGIPQLPPIAVFSVASLVGILVGVRMFSSVVIDSPPIASRSASVTVSQLGRT